MIDVHATTVKPHPNWYRPAPAPKTVAELLLDYRTRAGLNQSSAARAVGIATSILAGYEQGKKVPFLPSLVKLIDYYDLSSVERYELYDAVEEAVRQKDEAA